MFENIFETVNSGFAQALYEDYLRDPQSVPPEWRELFENGLQGDAPVSAVGAGDTAGAGAAGGAAATAERGSPAPTAPSAPGSPQRITGPALRLLQNMEVSLEVPTATSFRDVDVAHLWAVRAALNRALTPRDLKLSFTHLIGWAIVQAAKQIPAMVHAVAREGDDYYRQDPGGVHLGLAVDVEGRDGKRKLLVPVIKRADAMAFRAFYEEYERLVAGARDGKLMPDAYMGGTITLTNPGTIGTVASVPRLMKGQGSIIATGAIREVGGTRLMTLTSTYDHRIIQGAESGMFLRVVDQLLQGAEGFYGAVAEAMEVEPGAAEAAMAAGAAISPAPAARGGAVDEATLRQVAAAMAMVDHHRSHGYLAAHLDPLGVPPRGDPSLDPAAWDLAPPQLARIPASVLRVYAPGDTVADVLPKLSETYCGTVAYEIEHIANHEEREWLRRVIESGEHRKPLSEDERRQLLERLTRVGGLEQFLQRAYLGQKRFSIEGLDTLVPMLHKALDLAAEQGADEIVIGMAHRGRLNVLAHILGVPYQNVLREFEGGLDVDTLITTGRTGDVKYHHGAHGIYRTSSGAELDVSLMPNPSHLEAVNPVVVGSARARQSDRSAPELRHAPASVLPVLIHGDAAFAAQGVVAETLNLARLEGYTTGGTLHIIANNQIGFTTNPGDARSTDFASDLAKGFDVPIVHVNADDPHACLTAVRLAMMYRQKFHGDVVINLVGYRRHGHNECDEPRYTQPLMYRRVDDHPTVRELYATAAVDDGVVTEEEAEEMAARVQRQLRETQDKLRQRERGDEGSDAPVEPPRRSGVFAAEHEPATAVGAERLRDLNEQLLTVPDGFRVNRKLQKLFEQRRGALDGQRIEWSHAESLAYASLLVEGIPIRLTGQDTERGTFSQRHLTLHDAEDGRVYTPIRHLPDAKAPLELHNSPLSEYGAMGFEYGYSVAAPETLVLWEAQFGDFVNGGEIIIDQFIVAGLAKWGQTSRLTLLLPHGYEGQGPEHSSARLERFLALGAENNIRVANCSTPAQYFHLLRRQATHTELRPLVLMTPKSLLRLPQAASTLGELTEGRFHHVMGDPALPGSRDDVTRLVLCSGKIYYDTVMSGRRPEAAHVAVGRVELLYPWPAEAVRELITSYPNLREVVWLQEEPKNFGARKWAIPRIGDVLPRGLQLRYVSRPERASPAEGYPAAHKQEQDRLVTEVLA